MKVICFVNWYLIYFGTRNCQDGDCDTPGLLCYNDEYYLFTSAQNDAYFGARIRISLWFETEFSLLFKNR